MNLHACTTLKWITSLREYTTNLPVPLDNQPTKVASKKRTPLNPTVPLLLDGRPMEQVSNYRYLGVMVTRKLSWSDHIEQICTKARRLVGMLYRQFYCWADTTTLLTLYLTCIRPHLEYACTLWDPYTCKETHMIESVQKFACKVCLK